MTDREDNYKKRMSCNEHIFKTKIIKTHFLIGNNQKEVN